MRCDPVRWNEFVVSKVKDKVSEAGMGTKREWCDMRPLLS
jgi:hypothetical protein